MNAQRFSTEMELKVYNDHTGEYIRVGMDDDALNLVQLSYFEKQKQQNRIVMEPTEAFHVYAALGKYLNLTYPELFKKLYADKIKEMAKENG